jgi:hypothetical protein
LACALARARRDTIGNLEDVADGHWDFRAFDSAGKLSVAGPRAKKEKGILVVALDGSEHLDVASGGRHKVDDDARARKVGCDAGSDAADFVSHGGHTDTWERTDARTPRRPWGGRS